MILTILIWIVLLALAVVSYVLLARWKKKRWFFGLFFLWVGIAMTLPVNLSPKLDFSAIIDSIVSACFFSLGLRLQC